MATDNNGWRSLSIGSVVALGIVTLVLSIASVLAWHLPPGNERPPMADERPPTTGRVPTRTVTPTPPGDESPGDATLTVLVTPTALAVPTATLTPTAMLTPTILTAPTAMLTLSPTPNPPGDQSPGYPTPPAIDRRATQPFPAAELGAILGQAGGTVGVVVYDLPSETLLYSQGTDAVFSAASVIKLPIALTVYRLAEQGTLDLDARLTLQAEDIVGGTGVIQNDPVGTTYTIRELCRFMISQSDNTATNMLIRHIGGFAPVNALMAELGATQTRLQRLMMDVEALQAGRDNLTSPGDMFGLLYDLERSTVVSAASRDAILSALQATTDRQKLPALLPPDALVMHKVGSLPGVEHDVGIVQTGTGQRYLVVFLMSDLTSNQAGIAAIAQASRLVFDYESQRDK